MIENAVTSERLLYTTDYAHIPKRETKRISIIIRFSEERRAALQLDPTLEPDDTQFGNLPAVSRRHKVITHAA